MKYRIILLVLFSLLIVNLASASDFVIVNNTENDFYSLEKVTVSGNLSENKLMIEGSGEVISGKEVKVYLFGKAKDIVLKNVYLNGEKVPVSYDSNGYFFVVNEPKEFVFDGDIEIRNPGQLQLFVPGPMNELEFDLKHGYAVKGDRYGLENDQVTLQRSEEAAMLVNGNFRYSYSERNSFLYKINFKSFGSTLGHYTFYLENNENILSVDGVLDWSQNGNRLRVELESDKSTVTVKGTFDDTNIRLPMDEGKHNVVIESDPEKKISINTKAREVDLSEASLPPTYPNARAFIARSHEYFNVNVEKLDLMPSLSASVDRATNNVAITKKGSIVGDVKYDYSNTGVDYIDVDVDGKPLYASTREGPVKLTKDDELMLAFPKSEHGELELTYFSTRPKIKPIDLIDVSLAQTDLPITKQDTNVYLPNDYFVLGVFGADGGSELPSFKMVLLFVILVGGLAYIFRRNLYFAGYYVLFAAGLLYFEYKLMLLLFAVTIFLLAKEHLKGKKIWKWVLIGAGVFIAVGVVIFVAFVFLTSVTKMGTMESMSDQSYEAGANVEESQAVPDMKGLEKVGEDESGAITVPTKKGVLPVKMQIPKLGKQISVQNHLVTKENPVELRVMVIATWFKYIFYLIALVAGYMCFRLYKKS